MPEFEINPSIQRRIFETAETSMKPGGFLARTMDALGAKGLLPGGSQNPFVYTGTSLASAVGHRMGRFDTIATGKSGKFGRDLWRETWLESRKQMSVINANNEKAGITVPEHIVHNTAMRAAVRKVGGSNNELWIAFLKGVIKEHGPVYGPSKAAFLANNLQVMMGDQPYSPMKFGYDVEGNIKFKPEGRYETSDLFKNVMGQDDLYQQLKGKWHPAEAPGPIDKIASKITAYSHFALAPAAALKHVSQYAGLASNMTSFQNGYVTYGSFFGKGRQNAIAMMKANDAGADMFTEIIADQHRYATGWYSKVKWLNPRIGKWVARQGATPFLRGLRHRLIPMSAAQGAFVLHESAEILGRDPTNRAAQINLKYLGLEPSEVMREWGSNNGAFTRDANGVSETIKTAINNSIDQRVFFNNPGYRSALALSPTGRLLTAYHWMGQNEKSWFQRELVRAYQSRNPMQIGSLIATMSLLYPGVHWAMAKFNDVTQGKINPLEAAEEIIDPTQDAKMQSHIFQTYVDMMGYGVEWSKINAAVHHQLLEEGVGAQGKAAANHIMDFTAGVAGAAQGDWHKTYPLWRDILEDLPFHIGGWVAHTEFPTRAEQQANKPLTSKRMAAERAAQKRKGSQQ